MPLRFRPFGVVGSVLEVFVGLWILHSVLWSDEDYFGWFETVEVVLGAMVIGAGAIGITTAFRRALIARNKSN